MTPDPREPGRILGGRQQTRRFWTGATWTEDGGEEEVIGNTSETIATELAKVSQELSDYDRPIR